MTQKQSAIDKLRNSWINILFMILLFIGFYVFFRYVHPVVPWDGDDWATIGGYITTSDYGIPLVGEYEQIFPTMLATMMGYIAAYVIYPLSGDYIGAIVAINSIVLALSILLSIVMIYSLFRSTLKAKKIYALLGIILFLLIGFLMFKTTNPSIYLYWQYNVCTLYYYCVPSYIASAYIIFLIMKESSNKSGEQKNPFKQGMLIASAYFVIFSFVPAATLVAAVAFWYVIDWFIKTKNIVQTLKHTGFYIIVLVLYCVVIYAEFGRTFGTGYISGQGNLFEGIARSFQTIMGSFLDIHPMIKVLSIVVIALSAIVWIRKKLTNKITDKDEKYSRLLVVLVRTLLSVFVFFILFGAVSYLHINRGFMRMDSLYVFYFLVLLLVAICAVYLLENSKHTIVWMPLILCMLIYPIISPKYPLSGSIYTDSTAKQRYEIMSEIVEEAKRQDGEGQIQIRAHVPYAIYGGPMDYILYIHNVVGQRGVIEVLNDPGVAFYMES